MTKHYTLLIFIIVSSIILTACSQQLRKQEEAIEENKEVEVKEQISLNGVFLNTTWGEVTQKLAEEYENETGVSVNIELVGRDMIFQKLALSIAGNANYDLFNVDYNWVPELVSTNSLQPLETYIEKNKVDTEGFLPRALALTQWNGENGGYGEGGNIYGLPQTIHPHILWYRSDLFEDEKLKSEFKAIYGYDLSPPKKMQQFRDIAKFFNGKIVNGKKIYGWAGQASEGFGNVHTWLTFVYSNGGDVIDWNKMTSSLSTPEVIEATKTWIDLLQFSPPGINNYTFSEVSAAAAEGNVAMAIHWSWAADKVDDQAYSTTVGQWEFVQTPAMKSSVPHLAGWSIVIPRTSKYPEEAFKFMVWLESKQNDVRQAQMGGGDPVRLSSYLVPTLKQVEVEGTDVNKFRRYEAVNEAMKTAKARPFFPQEEQWESVVTGYLHDAQLGEMSVEEALMKADEAVNNLLR
ncbi:sugar ABC transporter substrate-binding protein [Metabacillus litoralis]|uniref:ABC transporter substrate-binding protein n=1 Tax=Metabacillus litoralis TaxID=152268 RepID=UPI001BA2D03C|nr:sugar ABC transporter substrate-binding protein [Metabacillus litoralis]UHA60180.1 sugar ABC transporter substrate-binding protein [Metabacillus litoralis]